jgi:hypothetical protein
MTSSADSSRVPIGDVDASIIAFTGSYSCPCSVGRRIARRCGSVARRDGETLAALLLEPS